MRTNIYNDINSNGVPPFIAFGAFEKNENGTDMNYSYYDPITQKSIFPFAMGSDKKVTKSAKNIGSFIFPKYKNTTDDAKEK